MHRDIKPGNVVFSGGIPKLMDFGIARPVAVSIHTLSGNVPGTIPYMAPESCTGGDTDFRSDIYQSGLRMYECISGVMAYPQTDIATICEAIKTGQRKPLSTSTKAAAIVNKCLELDPNKRYQTAADCLADVKALYHAVSPQTALEAQISAYLSGTTPIAEKTAVNADGKGMKRLILAAVAIPCFLLVVGLIVIGLAHLNKSINPPAPAATPPTAEPQLPPPAATPAPQPTTPPRPKPAPAPAQPAVRSKSDIRDSRDIRDIQDIRDSRDIQTTAVQEDAQHLINEAKKLLAQNNAQDALAKYQQALKTPSATLARGEIVKQSLYGTAKCNSILFSQNKIPRSNYEAAWKSVKNAYPAGTPEHTEAIKLLDNGATE
jgi:serine/threonine protein kinase